MDIIDFEYGTYDENVKDLLLELQEYIASIDEEKYNIVTDRYREENFRDTIKELEQEKGKIYLARDNGKVVGLIMGHVFDAEDTYDFKAPKGGVITELIVTKNAQANGIGQALLNTMEKYFKNSGCERVLIEVFEYNEIGRKFYSKNEYFSRVTNMMKKL